MKDKIERTKEMKTVKKVKLYLCLIKHHARNTYGGNGGKVHTDITSAVVTGEL
jgi:hypothetical protein